MKCKLLALDIDGTILTTGNKITAKTINILNVAREKGLLVTLATGRNYLNVKHIAKKLKITLPVISNDGAYIVNIPDSTVIFEKRMVKEAAYKIIQTLDKYDLRYMIHHESVNIINRRMRFPGILGCLSKKALGIMLYEKGTVKIVHKNEIFRFIDAANIEPFKFSAMVDCGFKGRIDEVAFELADKLGSEISIYSSMPEGFEITSKGISKAKGLEVLARQLGIDKSEIIAIGDSFNDIQMIQYAGLGIAMGNAPKYVQEQAKFVTKSNDENGVAYALEKFYLNV